MLWFTADGICEDVGVYVGIVDVHGVTDRVVGGSDVCFCLGEVVYYLYVHVPPISAGRALAIQFIIWL